EPHRLERVDGARRPRGHVAVAAGGRAGGGGGLGRRPAPPPAPRGGRAAGPPPAPVGGRSLGPAPPPSGTGGPAPGRRPHPPGARTFIHSGRRGRSATGIDSCIAFECTGAPGAGASASLRAGPVRAEKEPDVSYHQSLADPRPRLLRAVHGRPRRDRRERRAAL